MQSNLRDKGHSVHFKQGVEIKATCGSVPSPAFCQRRGFQKPDIVDERITIPSSYDWKDHHHETNRLVGVLWDFKNRTPTLVAVFYCDSLEVADLGNIVQPREGGGRTTSVSMMTRNGVKKCTITGLLSLTTQDMSNF